MACMHKETFEIYHNDQHLITDGYFEVDETIAPAIQVLNRKGYLTEICCAGHSVVDWLIWGENGLWESKVAPYSYITFKEGIILPNLPPGFVVEGDGDDDSGTKKKLCIVVKYRNFNKGVFERSRNILETMELLHEWALSLPDFNFHQQTSM
ncbi:MAG: hypothetical protein FWD23_03650 [Oscillospiraceae bacterium]|nr:hypothetical protein [Oscillospiraceae bacterium]